MCQVILKPSLPGTLVVKLARGWFVESVIGGRPMMLDGAFVRAVVHCKDVDVEPLGVQWSRASGNFQVRRREEVVGMAGSRKKGV